jgi:predicted nucleic acid-binding protein
MSGKKGLLDSNIIIYASKGSVSTDDLIRNYDFLYTSIISYVETLGYPFPNEEEKQTILQILRQVEMVDLDKTIADIAVVYRQNKKIKLPDALVLATAKHLEADLITSDVSDFKNVDKSVRIVTPKDLK